MKKIILIAICVSLFSCKKEKLDSCVIGKWQLTAVENNGTRTPFVQQSFYWFNPDGKWTYDVTYAGQHITLSGNYTINSNIVILSDSAAFSTVCNGNELKLHPTPTRPPESDSYYMVLSKL